MMSLTLCITAAFLSLSALIHSTRPAALQTQPEHASELRAIPNVSRSNQATATFAAHEKAWLFINGKHTMDALSSRRVYPVNIHVKNGDVIAIKGKNTAAARGIYFNLNNRIYTSDQSSWRAAPMYHSTGWMGPDYSLACLWQSAIVTHPKGPKGVPAGKGQYVWAREAMSGKGIVFLRYVVGGDNFCTRSSVTVAANGKAWVFLNGKLKLFIDSDQVTRTATLDLKPNDVVSVKANGPFAAHVFHKGQHYVTKSSQGPWKVSAQYKTPYPPDFSFQKFNDCRWKAGSRPSKPVTRALGFPYSYGGEYVTAPGATVVFGRFVVGGENRCNVVRPKTCRCQIEPSRSESKCYFFIDSRLETCGSRRCEPRYICAPNGKLICVKKKITHRIVPKAHNSKYCVWQPILQYIYVPYDQRS